MRKFVKKSVAPIEATQLHMTNAEEVILAMRADGYEVRTYSAPPMKAVTGIQFKTANGEIICSFGEYIIKGTKGEYYPCPAEIFIDLYEEVKDGE